MSTTWASWQACFQTSKADLVVDDSVTSAEARHMDLSSSSSFDHDMPQFAPYNRTLSQSSMPSLLESTSTMSFDEFLKIAFPQEQEPIAASLQAPPSCCEPDRASAKKKRKASVTTEILSFLREEFFQDAIAPARPHQRLRTIYR
ncbi:expressed unknown protein [Seminavis robusta]|uniref:Uncharacterized protein n=1 Tax=Seminavis robusta TaxID=568900 RepID=A0A9N8HV66_9STRA|nr:expressed unknown protein [Seminavis robusta]|eukprot:Sro2249_g320730.1 n/a (145) ;mRNA; f:7239-7673